MSLEARVTEALAMSAEPVGGAVLRTRRDQGTVLALVPGEAQAAAAPAEPLVATFMRTRLLHLAGLPGEPGLAHALTTLAAAVAGARISRGA